MNLTDRPILTRTTRLTIGREGAGIHDETAISVTIDDEGAGEFLVIQSNTDGLEPGELRFDSDEWPHLVAAVKRLLKEVVEP